MSSEDQIDIILASDIEQLTYPEVMEVMMQKINEIIELLNDLVE